MTKKTNQFKAILIIIFMNLIISTAFAQAPNKMSYQCVVRNTSNVLISNSVVGIQISILQTTSTGTPLLIETHTPTTNINGLASIEIGAGTFVSGSFSSIDWSAGPYFISTEIDPTGGTAYTISGTSELLSVPYAMYAAISGNVDTTWKSLFSDVYNTNLGNVGIGTSAPAEKLTVIGNIKTDGLIIPTNAGAGKVLTSNVIGTATWQNPAVPVATGWSLLGNSGTVATTNFIGTTDDNNVVFRRNGIVSGTISDLQGNTSFGVNSLTNNTTGLRNTATGKEALNFNTTGNDNTATGKNALSSNTIGSTNTATGSYALYSNTSGMENTADGAFALSSNSTGNYNTGLGDDALKTNSTGNENTAVGTNALVNNFSGNYNTGIGKSALAANSNGNSNTATGQYALLSNSGGSNNTANGKDALRTNNNGSNNVAIGKDALFTNNSADNNTAIGTYALFSNTSANNTAMGFYSLYGNTSGDHNTANGFNAMYTNTLGFSNTAMGAQALYTNNGNYNTALGRRAAFSNTIGAQNTVLGESAHYYNSTGANNTIVGYNALYNNNGSNNTVIGNNALLSNISGNNNIAIGSGAVSSSNTVSNEVTIGSPLNNSYRMYAASWTNVSDARLKHNIEDISVGLDFIMKLRPRIYVYNNANNEKKSLGFVAQEVKEVIDQSKLTNVNLVNNLDGEYLGLNTTEIIPILVKATQEQQEIIAMKSKEISDLKAQLQNMNNRLEALEQK